MLPTKLFSQLSLAVVVTSMTTAKLNTAFVAPVLAQTPTTFPVPSAVPQGTSIRIDGSTSMATINETLKQRFEAQFPGTGVTVNYSGSDAALQALSEGKIDLAAIGRPLTAAEKARGLVAVPLNRGKIAVIVGSENPFKSSITVPQFIQIVRGEITDWSQVGGEPRPIRFIDRPDLSDTRAAFGTYDVFQQSPYQPGATATRLSEDSTREAIAQLGRDGISFAPANQITNQPNVRPLLLYNTLPSDPRYPFSQPYYYVYNKTPSPGVAAFLGFGTDPNQILSTFQPTEAAINAGGTAAVAASPGATASPNATASPGTTTSPNATVSPNVTASPDGNNPVGTATTPNGDTGVGAAPGSAVASAATEANGGLPGWLWWLLPIASGAALLGLLFAGRRSRRGAIARSPEATQPIVPPRSVDVPPPPPPVGPSVFASSDLDLATRTGTVITSDRASMRQIPLDSEPLSDAIAPPTQAEPISPVSADLAVETDPALSSDLNADLNAELPEARSTENGSISDMLPGAAALGGAALAGAAFTRFRSGDPATTDSVSDAEEPLATFDVVEDLDNLEAQIAEGDAVELTLDDAPSTIESDTSDTLETSNPWAEPSEAAELDLDAVPSVIEASEQGDRPIVETDLDALDPEEPSELNFDAVPSVVEENNSGATSAKLNSAGTAAMTALGGAGLAAIGLSGAMRSPETESSDAPLEPTQLNSESFVVAEDSTLVEEPVASSSIDLSNNGDSAEFQDTTELTDPSFSASDVPEPSNFDASVALGGAALAAGVAGVAAFSNHDAQTDVEATKYNVGQTDLSSEALASVDEGLPELPSGYGESRIILMPRDPQWAYAYWDVPNEHREEVRRQGGQNLVLRLADVTDLNGDQSPHSLQQYDCDEMARDWYLAIPVSDRDYVAEIGYLTADGHWLLLARSQAVRIPPVYPSDWFDDQFVTIHWDDRLQGRTFGALTKPTQNGVETNGIYDRIFALTQGADAQRVAGSLFGSMHQVPETAVSSFVFSSGMGMWALPTPSGMGMSGINMSGVGFSVGAIPIRPRKFWLVADAELIVYGATEPDATVTIAGQHVPLNSDGTFRFQMSFQDGLIDYPIMAVASDGEQTRSIHLKFTRETPRRNTNTKEEAVDEWQS